MLILLTTRLHDIPIPGARKKVWNNSTDRNVLNLPAIGKSMTFQLVGIMPDGRRVLCFYHDSTRKHSPIIEKFGKVYILENKSMASYLRQRAS